MYIKIGTYLYYYYLNAGVQVHVFVDNIIQILKTKKKNEQCKYKVTTRVKNHLEFNACAVYYYKWILPVTAG